MSIDFLPEVFTRVTAVAMVVPVSDHADLTDPSTRRVLVPAQVELHLRRNEGTTRGTREYAYVSVIGPRRLKSGDAGKAITSLGWESGRNSGRNGYVVRPAWLTALLGEHLPAGWSPLLVDLEVAAS